MYRSTFVSKAAGLFFVSAFIRLSLGGCPLEPSPVPLPNVVPEILEKSFLSAAEVVRTLQESNLVPSVHFSVTYNQSLVFSQGFGSVDGLNTSNVPTLDTCYRLGSNTKLFTTLLMLQLEEQGLLDLDDSILKYWPSFSMRSPWPGSTIEQITFRQLASHMAGLPRECPCLSWSENACPFSTFEMLHRLQEEWLILYPDERPNYSNLGFALLGNILGSIVLNSSGFSLSLKRKDDLDNFTAAFEQAVTERILQPLNMSSTSFSYEGAGCLAKGFMDLIPAPIFELGWMSPAGQIYSSSRDVSKFLSFIFQTLTEHGKTGSSTVLKPEKLREWQLPRYINTDQASGFGIPWEFASVSSTKLWARGKGGYVPGYTSEIIIIPSQLLGISTLCSAGPPTVCGSMASQATEIISEAFYNYFAQMPQYNDLPANASSYVGSYSLSKYNLTFPAYMKIEMDSSNSSLLMSTKVLGIELSKQILRWESSHSGEHLDVFVLSPKFSEDEFAVDCMEIESGYYYQRVEFRRREGRATLSIPGLYYGLTFELESK